MRGHSPAPSLSVVVPVFNERESLPELYRRITAVGMQLGFLHELILVDDGSTDGSWDVIKSLALADLRVKAVALSRNFGHQPAIAAGLRAAAGEAVVTMDADLQDPPEVITHLYAKFSEGYDVVFAQRRARHGETLWKRASAKVFYRLMRKMTAIDMPVDTGDFRLMSRRVVDELCQLRERNPFMRGLVTWVGYRQTGVLYDREPRFKGQTKFSNPKMIRFAFDGITSFSSRPLHMAAMVGALIAAASLLLIGALIVYKLSGGTGLIPGWTSLIVVVLLLGGLNLMATGLLGEYVARVYDQVKGRPLYLVRDRLNLEAADERETGVTAGQSQRRAR